MSSLEGADLKFYYKTYGYLTVATILEILLFVAAFRWHIFDLNLGTALGLGITLAILIGIALPKVYWIVMNYMHVKWEPRSIVLLFASPIFFVLVMIAVFVLMRDYRY